MKSHKVIISKLKKKVANVLNVLNIQFYFCLFVALFFRGKYFSKIFFSLNVEYLRDTRVLKKFVRVSQNIAFIHAPFSE